jgi:hypothetical protein
VVHFRQALALTDIKKLGSIDGLRLKLGVLLPTIAFIVSFSVPFFNLNIIIILLNC